MHEPLFLVVDLFCGAGGTTTGFTLATREQTGIAKVIACVNHDAKAIESHWKNHPEVKHFEEDMRTMDLTELVHIVAYYQKKYPNSKLILWASLECTNFSKAKGGLPRDADSRTLADHLDRYITALQPDYIQIENVVEFMSWGPLDKNGKPISKKNGQDWLRWRKHICSLGYVDDWKELNSANYGAYTSRNRLFGVFARPWLPIAWPAATHAKKPEKSMHGNLKKWNAVREKLDLDDQGISIFNREKPLVDKTLERIYAGLVKFVANGDTHFLSKYYSGNSEYRNVSVDSPAGVIRTNNCHALVGAEFLVQTYAANSKGDNVFSTDKPGRTITTRDSTQIVQPQFLVQRNAGEPSSKVVDVNGPARTITGKGGNQDLVSPEFLTIYNGKSIGRSVDEPSPVIATNDRLSLVSPQFLAQYYSSGGQLSSIDSPAPVLPTKDRISLLSPEFFIDKHYGKSQNQSVDEPVGTIMPNDKHRLVEAVPFLMPTNFDNKPRSIDEPCGTITADRHHHYLMNPCWGKEQVHSVEVPCPVIIARQDKTPLSVIACSHGKTAIPVYDTDSEVMVRIKKFMATYGLVDIKMRMLRVSELLKIQGFPNNYQLAGSQADQKKFIGNSVVPDVVKAWTEAMGMRLLDSNKKVA